MADDRKPNWDSITRNVVGGAILLLLGYMLSISNDRFRGSEARRAFDQVYTAMEAVETRLANRIKDHSSAGPHDDVAERLRAIEIELRLMRQSSYQLDEGQ